MDQTKLGPGPEKGVVLSGGPLVGWGETSQGTRKVLGCDILEILVTPSEDAGRG